jgi:hypothetical protein
MLAWTTISYGAALSALAALVPTFLVACERRPGTLVAVAVAPCRSPCLERDPAGGERSAVLR